jgi:hypothetical protein
MKDPKLPFIIPFVIIMFLMSSCGGGTKKKLEKVQVKLVSEGPVYSGSNTATGTWKPDLQGIGKVKSARFTTATISSTDTTLAGIAENLVLQMAAPETEMKKIAFHKGSISSNEVKLQVAEEQEGLKTFFKGQDITFVIDYDLLPEEINENLQFTLEFDVEITTD